MNSNLIPNNYTLFFFFFHEWFHCLGRNGSELIKEPRWKHSRPLLLQKTWPTAEQHQCDQLVLWERSRTPAPDLLSPDLHQNWDLLSGAEVEGTTHSVSGWNVYKIWVKTVKDRRKEAERIGMRIYIFPSGTFTSECCAKSVVTYRQTYLDQTGWIRIKSSYNFRQITISARIG